MRSAGNTGTGHGKGRITVKPHKHRDLIIAWANGAAIQFRPVPGHGEWMDEPRHLLWDDHAEYRIKPEPKPDIVLYTCVYPWKDSVAISTARPNLRLLFDGETAKLKSAEVV